MSGQWAKVPEDIAYADLDCTALRVFIIMAAKAGRDRVTWITQRTIAERLGLHRRTIGRAIQRLEKLNLVRKCGKVIVNYDLGTWIQKYNVAPYLPEGRLGRASDIGDEKPEGRLGGTRGASTQGPDAQGQARSGTHSVPSSSDPKDSPSASSPSGSPPPWVALGITYREWNDQGQPQPQERTKEEPDLNVSELHTLGEVELVEEVAYGTA